MGVFFCERELCEFFKSNNKIFDIKFDINFKEVTISIFDKGKLNANRYKLISTVLWKILSYLFLDGQNRVMFIVTKITLIMILM